MFVNWNVYGWLEPKNKEEACYMHVKCLKSCQQLKMATLIITQVHFAVAGFALTMTQIG